MYLKYCIGRIQYEYKCDVLYCYTPDLISVASNSLPMSLNLKALS